MFAINQVSTRGRNEVGNQEIPIDFIVHMSQDLQVFIEVYQRLQEVISDTNSGYNRTISELEQWRETYRRNQAYVRRNFQKAKKVIQVREEENMQLREKITSLEIELSLANISLNHSNEEDDCDVTQQIGDEPSAETAELVKRLRKELKDVKTLLKITTTERNQLRLECEENHNQIQLDRAKLMEEHETLMNAQLEEIGKKENELVYATERIENLQKQVTSLIDEIGSFKALIERNESESSHRIKTLESEHSNMKENCRQKCDENRMLRHQIEEKKTTIKNLGLDLETCRHRHGIEIQNHQSEKDELYARLVCSEDSLNKRHDDFVMCKQRFQSEKESDLSRINSLEEDISFFKQQLNTYTQDFAIEREEATQLREEATRLREHLENHKRLLQEKEQMILRLTTPSSDHNP